MSLIVLAGNQYGKAENRVVRIRRETPRHEIRDVNVSTVLRGDFEAAYTEGDQAKVLPTDSQKQAAFAYAKTQGLTTIEEYAIALARHFVDDIEPVESAQVLVDEYTWQRVVVDGREHDHTWVRSGREIRTASVVADAAGATVTGGLRDLVILKSTGSEFAGFRTDPFTVLQPTDDRVLATSLDAQWRFASTDVDWDAIYPAIVETMTATFATLHSKALQQTLFAMGKAVLERFEVVAEVRLTAPNKHHFAYDLARFGIENRGEVFHADDRPYGLIEATVGRS